jgi:hypothetical protein
MLQFGGAAFARVLSSQAPAAARVLPHSNRAREVRATAQHLPHEMTVAPLSSRAG